MSCLNRKELRQSPSDPDLIRPGEAVGMWTLVTVILGPLWRLYYDSLYVP